MHDSTHAARNRRQDRATWHFILAAVCVLIAVVVIATPALGAASLDIEVSRAPDPTVFDGNAVHDLAIERVDAGKEGLELSARLSDEGGLIERPIGWRIRTLAGEPVFDGETAIADIALAPGDFVVEVEYGAARFSRTVSLPAESRLIVSFVLNVGGMRVLPRLQGLGPPPLAAETLVYATAGPRRGELVASSPTPGEIVRVSAGDYRVVSRFPAGNVTAVTDVRVKPGILSAVEIDHAASLVRLSLAEEGAVAQSWRLASSEGEELATASGASAEFVLKPGSYTATARVGRATFTTTFSIGLGEERGIVLGE